MPQVAFFVHWSSLSHNEASSSHFKDKGNARCPMAIPEAQDLLEADEICPGLSRHHASQKETQGDIQSRLVILLVLRALAYTPSKAAQMTVALPEDVPEDRRRHSAMGRSHESDEDSPSDLPPRFASRKLVRNTAIGQSDVESQSDAGESLDSQDYESDPDEDDLQNLNGNELARTFDNEV
jgi:hypothetical protein